jgi:hypothetical protein
MKMIHVLRILILLLLNQIFLPTVYLVSDKIFTVVIIQGSDIYPYSIAGVFALERSRWYACH